MTGCTQFEEFHMLEFVPFLRKLKHIYARACGKISFGILISMLEYLPEMVHFDFDPKNIQNTGREWAHVIKVFANVDFGMGVIRYFKDAPTDKEFDYENSED